MASKPDQPPEYASSAGEINVAAMTSTAPNGIPVTRDAAPYPGETFIILHKPSNRAITRYKDGTVGLGEVHDFSSSTSNTIPIHGHCNESGDKGSSRCQWLCIERKGWLGFRSATVNYEEERKLRTTRRNLSRLDGWAGQSDWAWVVSYERPFLSYLARLVDRLGTSMGGASYDLIVDFPHGQ
ncbi:hypothetical protein V8F33_005725 [Rhypophila sp. PSN 637]